MSSGPVAVEMTEPESGDLLDLTVVRDEEGAKIGFREH